MNNKEQPSLTAFHIPRWNELPTVELYLDQVVKLINGVITASACTLYGFWTG